MSSHNDEILEALRPRMRQARVAHLRRLIAGLAVVPLLGIGAAAMAADGSDAPAIRTASDGHDGVGEDAPEVPRPEIGDPGADDADPGGDDPGRDAKDADRVADGDEEWTRVLSLGPLGHAEIVATDGGFELLRADLVGDWEIERIDIEDGAIVIVVSNGETIKVITIKPGLRDEIDVKITEVVIPTTTTTTTTTTAKPDPELLPPVVDRIVVEVPGKGSFVVEREGETLWLGNVQPNEGYDFEIVKAEGWKVWMFFTDGEWRWFGKALINEAGQIETRFWDEPAPAEPVYQWVEVPGVGAVQFKLWSDGLVYVKEWTSECCGLWDYNQGAGAEVAKVDFEGEGTFVIVEAWGTADGTIAWEISDESPPAEEPPAEEPPAEEPPA